jgi:hypothetical protein
MYSGCAAKSASICSCTRLILFFEGGWEENTPATAPGFSFSRLSIRSKKVEKRRGIVTTVEERRT